MIYNNNVCPGPRSAVESDGVMTARAIQGESIGMFPWANSENYNHGTAISCDFGHHFSCSLGNLAGFL